MRSFIAPLINTWGSIPRLLAQVHFSGLPDSCLDALNLEETSKARVASPLQWT
jgi:hypothetical protein